LSATYQILLFAEKYQVKKFDWSSDDYDAKTDVILAAGWFSRSYAAVMCDFVVA